MVVVRVQRCMAQVATVVPRDWPKGIMGEGGTAGLGNEGLPGKDRDGSSGGWFPSEQFLTCSSFWLKVVVVPVKEGTARPVKKYSTVSPSVLRPSSLGVPVLSPKPRELNVMTWTGRWESPS